jgi:hypothetical protein
MSSGKSFAALTAKGGHFRAAASSRSAHLRLGRRYVAANGSLADKGLAIPINGFPVKRVVYGLEGLDLKIADGAAAKF